MIELAVQLTGATDWMGGTDVGVFISTSDPVSDYSRQPRTELRTSGGVNTEESMRAKILCKVRLSSISQEVDRGLYG